MKITVIHSSPRREKSVTSAIAHSLIKKLGCDERRDVEEIYLPRDMPNFCRACNLCFADYKKCPDYEYMEPIYEKIFAADVIIITAPVYVFHAPAQLKAMLDHCAHLWMSHRPHPSIFKKQAVVISAAAGAGLRSTVKDVKDNMDFWGVAKTHVIKIAAGADSFQTLSEKRLKKIEHMITKTASKIQRYRGARPTLKVRVIFYWMRSMQKNMRYSKPDVDHWEANGWLSGKKPW